ncbi:S phase cyclin A-associated protein in the endoplasmic reticulum-like [Glandiceps talaboti]
MNDQRKRARAAAGGKNRPNSAGGDRENMKSERDISGSSSRTKLSGVSSAYKNTYQRTNSYDRVRKLVEQEGRTARNLVAWSVPFDDSDDSDGQVKVKSPRKPKPRSTQRSSERKLSKSSQDGSVGKVSSPTKPAKKIDLRARYWAFLFDNLQRAVDEIYQTCEADESIVECKEVIMMLKNCTRDFESLIERIQLQTAFENTDIENRPTSLVWEVRKSSPSKVRPPGWRREHPISPRPTSLAWEVRKTSPGKGLVAGSSGDRASPINQVNRSLTFVAQNAMKPGLNVVFKSPPPGSSWADKVKGGSPRLVQNEDNNTESEKQEETQYIEKEVTADGRDTKDDEGIEGDDGEGWETVQRKHKEPKQNKLRQLQAPSRQRSTSNGANQSRNHGYTVPHSSQSLDNRTRGDSEKENEPVRNSPSNVKETKSMSQLETELKKTLHIGEQPGKALTPSKVETKPKVNDTRPKVNDTKSHVDDAKLKVEDTKLKVETTKLKVEDSLGNDKKVGMQEVGMKDGDSGKGLLKPDMKQKIDPVKDAECRIVAMDTDDEETRQAMYEVLDKEETLTTELEKCHEEALASAIDEEACLSKEIEEEENKEINIETEYEEDSDLGNTASSMELSQRLDWTDIVEQYDSRDTASWADMVEVEERTPGHALHMHEKLSSPSRKRTRAESQRRHEEKQAKAQQLREKLQEDKANKLRNLNERINEVRAWKDELFQQRKKEMDEKLQRAEEKRMIQLQAVVKKAQEEEAKVNEIAFINTLEAQNKRHEIMTRHEVNEARLQDIQEERQRRQEEKAAKEEAAQERRRALEEERLAKLEAMQRHREDQQAKIGEIKVQRDKARDVMAKEKARDREIRLAALDAAQKAKEEEIQKKIQQKYDESSKRHSKLIEERREKAMELSRLRSFASSDIAPQHKPYKRKKLCNMCNVLIPSEVYLLSHLHGKKHKETVQESLKGKTVTEEEEENHSLKQIIDAPEDGHDPQLIAEKERHKAFRKRARKIRQRMTSKGKIYESSVQMKVGTESDNKSKLQKVVKDINKYLQSQGSGPWPANRASALDRALGEITRILDKKVQADQLALSSAGGLTALCRLLLVIGDSTETKPPVIPTKSLCNAANAMNLACRGCYDNCHYILCSNKLGPMVDMLMHRLSILIPDTTEIPRSSVSSCSGDVTTTLPHDPVAAGLMQLISTVLSCVAKNIPSLINKSSFTSLTTSPSGSRTTQAEVLQQWGSDIVSYVVCVGIVDKLTCYFTNVHEPVDEDPKAAEFLKHCLGLLVALTRFITTKLTNIFDESKKEDPTQLMVTLKSTEFAGIVSMLYGILLHGGAPARSDNVTPPELPEHTLCVVNMGLKMLNTFAVMDLKLLQSVLGEEGISLEFRHIATYLIWYCSQWRQNEDLCHEVMLIVGYFTVLNQDNQFIVQSGRTPTLLQQLCSLPFQYFSDPRLMNVLFPTLIACCYNNVATKKILEQEMSCSLLATFIEKKTEEKAKLKILPSATKTKDKEKEKDQTSRMGLDNRFSEALWEDAKKFFEH